MYFTGTKEIKFYVKKWIEDHATLLSGKQVLDLPAGNGVSAQLLQTAGAHVHAGDLFPEFFRATGINCDFVDMDDSLPYQTESMDYILCQEGIEHLTDQYHAFLEFSRVLKTGGRLLLTTPNYSNLKARVSHLITESELFGKIMPPNEVDSVWFSSALKGKVYFGHVNLIGIQKLRLFAKLAGLEIVKVHENRVNNSSLLLFPFLYPLICYFTWSSFRRMKRKKGKAAAEKVRPTLAFSISPLVLLGNHLIVELQKSSEPQLKHDHLKNSSCNFVT